MSLDLIRKKHTWFTRIVLILIGIVFIFGLGFVGISGLGSGGGVAPTGVAATVNGEPISMNQYLNIRKNVRKQYTQNSNIPQELMPQIDMMALNQLIELKLLAQKAREMGFRVSDEELSKDIHSNPGFQVNGVFVGKEAYNQYVEQGLRLSVPDFESGYRDSMVVEKLANFINETAIVTDEKLFNLYRLQNEKANLAFVEFNAENITNTDLPTDKELEDYYNQHKTDFNTPEQRSIRYLKLGPEVFRKNIEITDQNIKDYYDAYKSTFTNEDGSVADISVVRDEIADKLKTQQTEQERLKVLQDIQSTLGQKIDTLENLAKKYSADEIIETRAYAATNGPNDIPTEIWQRAFAFDSKDRYYQPMGDSIWFAELKDIVPSKERSFDQAKGDVIKTVNLENSRAETSKKAGDALQKLKAANKGEFANKAQALGLEVNETGLFTRTQQVPKIGIKELGLLAFSLNEGSAVAPKVFNNGNSYYIVALKEIEEVNKQEFENQKAQIEQQELARQRRALFEDWIQRLKQESDIRPNEDILSNQG